MTLRRRLMLMSALAARFSDGCVTFINGDERADEVADAGGRVRTLSEPRASAAQKFNAGRVRFLDVNGEPGAPLQGQSVLYFGNNPAAFMEAFKKFGFCVPAR